MNLKDITVTVGGRNYTPRNACYRVEPGSVPSLDLEVYLSPYDLEKPREAISIKNVIFNPPATIVFWSDNTKTVVRCDHAYDAYDPEKGLAMAISRKLLGLNKRDYHNIFRHWLKRWDVKKLENANFKTSFVETPTPTEDNFVIKLAEDMAARLVKHKEERNVSDR